MLSRLKDVFKSFHEHDVRYLVIGGIAAVAHGVPRATFDLDILIEATPRNAQRLLDALLGAGLSTAQLTDAAIRTKTPGIDFAGAWKRRLTMRHDGQEFHVLSKPDLIASKRASGRPVDLEDVRMLEGGAG